MRSNLSNIKSVVAESMNCKFFDSKISVSNSLTEPRVILKKFKNSFCDLRPAPSAMLAGTDMAARLSCEVSPNVSLRGKLLVIIYISLTRLKLYFQAFKFL